MAKCAPPVRSIGLIGYGAFARLTARHVGPHFEVRAYDPALAPGANVAEASVAITELAPAAGADVVVFATPVESLSEAITAARPHLRAGALVMDVGSVKVLPAKAMLDGLPDTVDVIGAHPLFGPQSAKHGIEGLKIALCPLRGERLDAVEAFLRDELKLQVIVTTPEQHDHEAAIVQGITHLIAKVMVQMEPLPTNLTTKSYDKLFEAIEMVRYDPPEVFDAIERLNPYSADVRERFFTLAEALRKALADRDNH
ncbi:MAG: prephenate dehydrogenase [Hyphomonadaceae bacterium]|nr:prephenate dehydrogenase [Hyphomonadaceae bacterium]